MFGLIVVWAGLLIALVIFALGRPGRGGALTLAYFLGLSLIHVPGVLPFLDPDSGLADWDETQLGFEMTILGMAAFVAGAVLARWRDRRCTVATGTLPRRAQVLERLGRRTFALGIAAYFFLLPLSGKVPSSTSIVAAFGTLLILGLWLLLYSASLVADWRRTLMVLALSPLLPLATLVTGGFLGYGVYWVLSVVAFLFVITRQRGWFYLGTPMALFLGLSLFVTYMGQRERIREVVWEEQPGLLERLNRVSAIVTEFQLLDLASPKHISALDGRLNQNWLVGAAIMYHEDGLAPFAYGATIPIWALIPRAVWPDKPETGGGGSIVSDYTGIQFSEGTSVGAGQVLEFYVNFGVPGVLIGFFGFGYLLIRLDRGIMLSLAAYDMRDFLLRAMPGLTMLAPGGNLLEIFVAFVAAVVAARLVISLKFFDLLSVPRSRREVA